MLEGLQMNYWAARVPLAQFVFGLSLPLRAFLMDPRILILDDATASVDSRTERFIQEAMRRLCQGRTSFIIAQRFSTVQHADLILVLNKGRIVEQGRHEELIKRSGFYREIFEQQLANKNDQVPMTQ